MTLSATPDILADVVAWRAREGRSAPLVVGFAAETEDVVARARAKRLRKGIDVIVANDVSRQDIGFDVDANAVTIIGADARRTRAAGLEGRRSPLCLPTVSSSGWPGSPPKPGHEHCSRSGRASAVSAGPRCGWRFCGCVLANSRGLDAERRPAATASGRI